MRRLRLAAGVVAVVLGAGCSEEQRPIQAAKPIDGAAQDKAIVIPPMAAPAASDPAAAAVVRAAIDAHTGGKPDLLRKLKSVVVHREGQGSAGGTVPSPLKWLVHASWPDRMRYRIEIPINDVRIFCTTADAGWMAQNGQKLPMPPEQAAAVRLDSSVEWLGFLFPLTDPATRFAAFEDAVVNGKPATGVRVWATGVVDAVLHFDTETKLLSRISFNGKENGDTVPKQVVYFTHKPFHGVTLGDKTVLRVRGNTMFEWTTTTLEPDARIDPAVFEKP